MLRYAHLREECGETRYRLLLERRRSISRSLIGRPFPRCAALLECGRKAAAFALPAERPILPEDGSLQRRAPATCKGKSGKGKSGSFAAAVQRKGRVARRPHLMVRIARDGGRQPPPYRPANASSANRPLTPTTGRTWGRSPFQPNRLGRGEALMRPRGPLRRSNFRVSQREASFAGSAHELRRRANIADGEDPRFVAPRTGRRGCAGIGVGGNFEILRDFSHPGRFQFKGGVAIVANVVVAALRLAGIKHVAGTALRTGHRNRRERHGISSMAQRQQCCQEGAVPCSTLEPPHPRPLSPKGARGELIDLVLLPTPLSPKGARGELIDLVLLPTPLSPKGARGESIDLVVLPTPLAPLGERGRG